MTSLTVSDWSEQHQTRKFPTAIVGPTPLLRESLSRFLRDSKFEIVSLWSTMSELIHSEEAVDQNLLAIVDACNHPGEVCQHIKGFLRRHPLARIVVLARHSAPADVSDMLRSGSHGYFATITTRADFIKSLELVMCGQTIIPSEAVAHNMKCAVNRGLGSSAIPSASGGHPDTLHIPRFTGREFYILRCLTEGLSNKLIARDCDIAEGTAKVHVKAILRKLKVSNRTQAAIWAYHNHRALWPEAFVDANRVSQPAQMPLQEDSSIKPIVQSHNGTAIMTRRAFHKVKSINPIAANAVHR